MPFKAIMKIEEKEYDILYSRFEIHQTLDDSGSVTSAMQYAYFYLELAFVKDDFLLHWATQVEDPKQVQIEEYFTESSPYKTLNLSNVYCIQLEEKFSTTDVTTTRFVRESGQVHSFITCITLTAGGISVRDATLQNF